MKVKGFYNIKPQIEKITFPYKGKFNLHLKDGRIIAVPLAYFPEIGKMSPAQLKKWYILDDYGFSFDDCNEVFHIEQVLGKYDAYKYSFVNEPEIKYKSKKPGNKSSFR